MKRFVSHISNKELDRDLELNYFGARYYQPEFPRFLSPDPVGGTPGVPISWNRYLYCRNDPVNHLDPNGKWVESALDITSLGFGLKSLYENVSEGNWCSAAVDLGGIVIDGTALALPLVPGGVGIVVKAGRQADRVGDFAGQIHHVASNKAIKSGFTAAYEKIFSKAGMVLDEAANKIFLAGHKGGHTKKYKQYVLDVLEEATEGLSGEAYGKALKEALADLKEQLLKNPKLPYKGGLD